MSFTESSMQMTQKTLAQRNQKHERPNIEQWIVAWIVELLGENETRNQIKNTFNVIIYYECQ